MNIIERQFLKVMLERASKRNIKEYPQMICFAHDTISRKIFIDGLFEKRELEVLKVFLQKELTSFNTCLDIGANIGNHSLFFSKLFDHVISFEPNNRTFKVLALNADLSKNVLAVNVGIGIEKATLKASVNPLNIGGAAINDSSEANIEFKIVALDEYLKESPSPSISFIKMDVEGHELKALQGASDTLNTHHPILALELHVKKERTQSEDILEFLEQMGYKYAHVFRSNILMRSKPAFIKTPINKFSELPRKNHKMVLFTVQ